MANEQKLTREKLLELYPDVEYCINHFQPFSSEMKLTLNEQVILYLLLDLTEQLKLLQTTSAHCRKQSDTQETSSGLTLAEREELEKLESDPDCREMKKILNSTRKRNPERQRLYQMRYLKKKYEELMRGE